MRPWVESTGQRGHLGTAMGTQLLSQAGGAGVGGEVGKGPAAASPCGIRRGDGGGHPDFALVRDESQHGVLTARPLPWARSLQRERSHGKHPRLHAHGKPHQVLLLPFSRASSPFQQPAFTSGVNSTDLPPSGTESPSPRIRGSTEARRAMGAPITPPQKQHPHIYSITIKAQRSFGHRVSTTHSRNCPALSCSALWEQPPTVVWILWGLVEGDGTAPSLPATCRLFPTPTPGVLRTFPPSPSAELNQQTQKRRRSRSDRPHRTLT